MSTQQQGIVDAIATLAATVVGIVTVTKFRSSDEAFSAAQLPAINVTAMESEMIQEHGAGTDERLNIVLSAFCSGATAASMASDYLAATLGKIGADETLAGKALSGIKGKRALVVKHGETVGAEAHQEINFIYRTPRWNF